MAGRGQLAVALLLFLLVASEPAQPPPAQPVAVLEELPREELRDVECTWINSALVKWRQLKKQASTLDEAWRQADQRPQDVCRANGIARDNSDLFVVIARSADAAAECTLGAITAAMMVLICTVGCQIDQASSVQATFENLWATAFSGEGAIPAYMLGTSSWPIAALTAKWQAHCEWTNNQPEPAYVDDDPLCASQDVKDFRASLQAAAADYIYPLLWRPESVVGPELMLGQFAGRILHPLATFMNSAAANDQRWGTSCAGAGVAQGIMLIFFRLLGPPVERDPLNFPRLEELGLRMASVKLPELLGATAGCFSAVMVSFRHLCWRSHNLFGEIPLKEVRRGLELGSEFLLQPGNREAGGSWQGGRGMIDALHVDRRSQLKLWETVAASQELQKLWTQLARWLLMSEGDAMANAAELAVPTKPVTLCMGFGSIDSAWVKGFVNRAVDVGLPRLIFITPDASWLLDCESVRAARKAEASVLCVRDSHTEHKAHYDHNNKAKFYMMPILLTLGVDVAWIDFDVYLFNDPTPRLVEWAYPRDGRGPYDVVVTDHFDEYCLNHGVFLVRASDRSLLWMLEYIKWMHWYPFGHDQNGWDAFLSHSIREPQLPEDLQTNPAYNVSYNVLSTEFEFVTLTGWAGDMRQTSLAQLLHFTTTQGMKAREKRDGLLNLFNATAPVPGEGATRYARRQQMAKWKALNRLRTAHPRFKRPCYEGIHMIMSKMGQNMYDELLA